MNATIQQLYSFLGELAFELKLVRNENEALRAQIKTLIEAKAVTPVIKENADGITDSSSKA